MFPDLDLDIASNNRINSSLYSLMLSKYNKNIVAINKTTSKRLYGFIDYNVYLPENLEFYKYIDDIELDNKLILLYYSAYTINSTSFILDSNTISYIYKR